MRVFREEKLEEVYCNQCGRKMNVENEIVKEGIFSIDYKWEYFSQKDGIKHSFDLCEQCYERMINQFKYPVEESDYTELI